MISKELLSEVLGIRTIVMDPILEPMSKIGYLVYGSQNTIQEVKQNHKQINIYELAHKCKEWAFEKGYTIIDYIDLDNDKFWSCRAYPNGLNDGFDWEEIHQPTSPISIFRTCQWILDNVKTNSLS